VNTGGSNSFLNCYKAVVGSIGEVIIISLGLVFYILAFRDSI
jgi:hypothetical protein